MFDYFKLAAQIADLTTDTNRKAFIGAIALRRDGLMVGSRNISAPSNGKCPLAHAEARVLRKAGWGAILYVARVKRDGSLALAKPCPTCQSYLCSKGVKSVYYTISDTQSGQL